LFSVDQKLPSVLFHVDISIGTSHKMTACFIRGSKKEDPQREKDREREREGEDER
jgi:hypothetical protein